MDEFAIQPRRVSELSATLIAALLGMGAILGFALARLLPAGEHVASPVAGAAEPVGAVVWPVGRSLDDREAGHDRTPPVVLQVNTGLSPDERQVRPDARPAPTRSGLSPDERDGP